MFFILDLYIFILIFLSLFIFCVWRVVYAFYEIHSRELVFFHFHLGVERQEYAAHDSFLHFVLRCFVPHFECFFQRVEVLVGHLDHLSDDFVCAFSLIVVKY